MKKLLMPFNINDESHEIECVVTPRGNPLINASQYTAAFTGCELKDAGNKLAVVANRISELQHCKRPICDHDKVSHLTYCMPVVILLLDCSFQEKLEFMAYLHHGANYYTLDGIITFTNECNAVKLNKDSYAGEPKHVVIEKIKRRREESIAAVQAGVAEIMEGVRRAEGLLPSGGANTAGKRNAEELEGESVEWERRVRASESNEREAQAAVAELEQCVGTTEATICELRAAAAVSAAKDLESQVTRALVVNVLVALTPGGRRPPSASSGRRLRRYQIQSCRNPSRSFNSRSASLRFRTRLLCRFSGGADAGLL